MKSGLISVAMLGLTWLPTAFLTTSAPPAIAQERAVIFAPPSNVRATPNGAIICTIRAVTSIVVYGSSNGWYLTDVCGQRGYIHGSQIQFTGSGQTRTPSIFCDVVNIQRGQLALRFSPNGESRAGLNNGNILRFIREQGIWYYVEVVQGPNSQVNGLQGWVNSNYLSCYDDA